MPGPQDLAALENDSLLSATAPECSTSREVLSLHRRRTRGGRTFEPMVLQVFISYSHADAPGLAHQLRRNRSQGSRRF